MTKTNAFVLGFATLIVLYGGAAADAASPLYPPEVRARIVVVEPGLGLQRHYWDPRYCALTSVPYRHPWQCPAPAGYGQWYFSF
jgi:hypothetical protein